MARTVILTDSTVDLPQDLIDANDIKVLPLYVTLDKDSLQDGVSVKPEDLYAYVERTGKMPKTSAATVIDFHNAFETFIEAGSPIIYIGISGKMSATVQQAQLAANEFPGREIRVIDGRSLSTGTALSVLKACGLARKGKSAEEIERYLLAFIPRVRASFVLDNLQYLYYGGRCSAVENIGAKLLKIKPCISVIDGEMKPTEKYRGSIAHAARQYAHSILEHTERIDPERCFITHSHGTKQAVIDAVREEVERAGVFGEVIESTAGCVITGHCGRDTIGLIYAEKPL